MYVCGVHFLGLMLNKETNKLPLPLKNTKNYQLKLFLGVILTDLHFSSEQIFKFVFPNTITNSYNSQFIHQSKNQ